MSTALRFTLCPGEQSIRLELPDGDSTYGTLDRFGESIKWQYGSPSDSQDAFALEAVLYDYGHDVKDSRGRLWAFGGYESLAEMDRQCSARCQTCRTVQASHDDLSLHGECTKCWARAMASAECQGCSGHVEAGHALRCYLVTFESGKTETVRYCDDCADLARMNWNGETASIKEAA
jgi:hypothetical protein